MNISIKAAVLLAAGVLLAGCGSSTTYGGAGSPSMSSSSGATVPLSVSNGHLVGAGGKALYLWVKDTGTASTCAGGCAAAWPPLTATSAPTVSAPLVQSKVALSKRSDGTEQVTYGGHPLYYFAGDSGPSDTTGQGSNGFGALWWLVAPAGTAISGTAAGSSSSAPGYGY